MEVIDPVCNMTIAKEVAVATSTYKGTTYYFCSELCKEDFDKNPEKFIGKEILSVQDGTGIDPVCGMTVDTESTHTRYDYEGETYFFCSEHCLEEFRKDPKHYINLKNLKPILNPINSSAHYTELSKLR